MAEMAEMAEIKVKKDRNIITIARDIIPDSLYDKLFFFKILEDTIRSYFDVTIFVLNFVRYSTCIYYPFRHNIQRVYVSH